MDGVTNVTTRTDRHVQAEQNAQLALRKVTEELRAANPIVDAAGCVSGGVANYGDCLRFDIQRQTDFSQPCVKRTIAYKLNRTAGTVTRDSTDWVWNSATSSCVATNVVTNRVMIGSLVYPATVPLFAYTDQAGGVVPLTKMTSLPGDDGPARIKVNLRVRYQARNAPDLVLESNAVLRNNR
jgi:hypothetical protein